MFGPSSAHPENVVLEMDSPSTLSSGILIMHGGRLGSLSGITLTRPNSGLSDLTSGDFSTTTSAVWGSTYKGIYVVDKGLLVNLSYINISGFSYGLYVERSSTVGVGTISITHSAYGVVCDQESAFTATNFTVTSGSTSNGDSSGISVWYNAYAGLGSVSIQGVTNGLFATRSGYITVARGNITSTLRGIYLYVGGKSDISNITITGASSGVEVGDGSYIYGQSVTITHTTTAIVMHPMAEATLNNTLGNLANNSSNFSVDAGGTGSAGNTWNGGSLYLN